MHEWHIDPVGIVGTWTPELLNLMVGKFMERKTREGNVGQPEALNYQDFLGATGMKSKKLEGA